MERDGWDWLESTKVGDLEAIPDWEVDERLRRGRRRMKLAVVERMDTMIKLVTVMDFKIKSLIDSAATN